MFKSYALSPVVSVINNADLADWLGVDSTDNLLPAFANTATSMVIEYLECELLNRDRVVVYEQWPYKGTDTFPSVSRNNAELCQAIDLPYARFATVSEALVFGEAYTDYRILDLSPIALYFQSIPAIGSDENPALKVTYTTGYGDTISDIPDQIKTAVTMLAAFMYEHRGACNATMALNESGAASVLTPFKMRVVTL